NSALLRSKIPAQAVISPAAKPIKPMLDQGASNIQETRSIVITAPAYPEVSPENRELVAALTRSPGHSSPLTDEAVGQWKENMRKLVGQGPAGVAAIREFLKTDTEIDFGRGAEAALGYPSARKALFDALAKIGGEEATLLIRDTLQSTAEPREVA